MQRLKTLILLFLIVSLGLILPVLAYSYTREVYYTPVRYGKGVISNEHPSSTTAFSALAGSFQTGSAFTLGYFNLSLAKVGSPTSTLVSALYAESDGKPTGIPLIYSDNTVDSSTLTTHTTYTWVIFNFTESSYELSSSTNYCLSVEANTTNVDADNYVGWGVSQFPNGFFNRSAYYSDAWTVISASYDWLFEIYSLDSEGQDLTFNLYENSLSYASMTKSIEVLRVLYENSRSYASVGVGKELLFTLFENSRSFASMATSFEGVAIALVFILYETSRSVASISVALAEALTLDMVLAIALLGFVLALMGIVLAIARKRG